MFPILQRIPATGSIAVIRALQLGDMLCAVPALRSLRHAMPSASITLIGLPSAASFAERFRCYVDHFEEFPGSPGIPEQDFSKARYDEFMRRISCSPFDLVIQLHGRGDHINSFANEMRPKHVAGYCPSIHDCPDAESFLPYPEDCPEIHRHLRLMRFLGATLVDDALELPLLARDQEDFSRIAPLLSSAGYVCIHVGSRWPSRRWRPSGYAEIAEAVAQAGLQIVFTGTPAESHLVRQVRAAMHSDSLDLTGKTSLGSMACLIRAARLLISNDTGASHIAAAMRTPSVIIVLGSDHSRWRPLDHKLHRVVRFPVSCAPCEHFECPTAHECSANLDVSHVFDVVSQQLAEFRHVTHCSIPVRTQGAITSSIPEFSTRSIAPKREEKSCADYGS